MTKMKLILFVFFSVLMSILKAQNVTKFDRKNIFLSRRKRFVEWPKGSNFVINFTCSKPLLRELPLTWNTVYEMDIPFAVINDHRLFFKSPSTKTKRHVLERKYLLEHLEDFITIMGMDGPACVNRLLCESGDFLQDKDRYLIKDLIKVLFNSFLDDPLFTENKERCEERHFESCSVSLLDIFINSSNENIEKNLLSGTANIGLEK